ncbi:MAG: hypothetical protein WCQ00_00060 [bacterium]
MTTNQKKLIEKTGGLFGRINAVVHPNDKGIIFKVNAEDCLQEARSWNQIKIVLLMITSLAIAAVIVDFGLPLWYLLPGTIIIGTMMGKFDKKNNKMRLIIGLAKKWSPNRRKLLQLTKGVTIPAVQQEYTDDADLRAYLMEPLFKTIANAIAYKVVKIESLTGESKHPKEDKKRKELNELAGAFNMSIPWTEIFKESVSIFGKRERI